MSKTRRFRLTKMAKILIALIIVLVIGGAAYAGFQSGFIKMPEKKEDVQQSESAKTQETQKATEKVEHKSTEKIEQTEKTNVLAADENGNVINTEKEDVKTINISLDEWIG